MATTPRDAGSSGANFIAPGVDSLTSVSKNAQAIAAEACDYAVRTIEFGGDTARKLFAAKSGEKVLEIQSAYVTAAYQGFVAETRRLGELYADLARDAYRPFEAIVVRPR